MNVKKYELKVNENRIPYLQSVGETALTDRRKWNQPIKIANLIRMVFDVNHSLQESVYLVCFDVKLQLLGIFEVSKGLADQALVDNAQIMTRALLCGAQAFALVHNHPSGVVDPSNNDIEMTEKVMIASQIMGLKMVDHIIVAGAGREGFYSFRKAGLL
ncbi:DNA repair protein RadC [Lachnospiraceae bacterium]|nr:DNA repair protein RadC [Lachnospiraceae bacterium]